MNRPVTRTRLLTEGKLAILAEMPPETWLEELAVPIARGILIGFGAISVLGVLALMIGGILRLAVR